MPLSHPTNRNHLLARLSPTDFEWLRPKLEFMVLDLGEVLFQRDERIEYVYFPRTGVMSLVVMMNDGRQVEAAAVGNEGMAGLPVFLNTSHSLQKAIVQVRVEVDRMEVGAFHDALNRSETLRLLLSRYTLAVLNQISQTAACNLLHTVEQRMCRWLLMCHDRVGQKDFHITQQFLAEMLCVRRASVTEVARRLQRAGLITYSRGQMTVLDRERLELAVCECYHVMRIEYDRLLGTTAS